MSAGSIFDPEENKSSKRTMGLIALIALIVAVSVGYAAYHYSKPEVKPVEVHRDDELRNSTVAMLAYRTFSGDEFSGQILGKGRLERLVRNSRETYFSYPEAPQAEFDEFVAKFFFDRTKLEMAREVDGKLAVGDYKMSTAAGKPYFFRTPLDNVKLDTTQTLSFPFKTVNYTVSIEENSNFLNNSRIYGGKLNADTSQKAEERSIVFANHGIMVAKPDEPSLMRLTGDLLKTPEAATDRESKIQRLVDFVSNEIRYDFTEAVGARETLKRPNEVLMTRSGDCSNKTILLASLLEQIGEDYILLYCPKHITVAVPQGNFSLENKMDFDWEGKKWVIAESTLAGFQIGRTRVKSFENLMPVNYVQRPREKDLIFDANSYRALEFR